MGAPDQATIDRCAAVARAAHAATIEAARKVKPDGFTVQELAHVNREAWRAVAAAILKEQGR